MGFKRGRSRSRSSSVSRKRYRSRSSSRPVTQRPKWTPGQVSGRRRYRRRSSGNVKVEGSGGQISYTARSNPRPSTGAKILMKANAPNYWYNSYATRLESVIGKAAIISTTLMGGGTFSATYPGYDNDLGAIQYAVETSITGASKTAKYLVEQGTHDFRMTNQDNGNVEIHIWDVIVKRDTNLAPVAAYVNGLNNMQGSTTINQFAIPAGVFPQQSSQFNQYYKVIKHQRVILGQGQSHSHTVKMCPKRMFHSELLSEANISIKGFTVHTLIQVMGMPQNDATTKTTVSLGKAAVDIAVTKMIKYRWNADDTQNGYFNQSMATAFPGGESVMNIGTGTATTETQA